MSDVRPPAGGARLLFRLEAGDEQGARYHYALRTADAEFEGAADVRIAAVSEGALPHKVEVDLGEVTSASEAPLPTWLEDATRAFLVTLGKQKAKGGADEVWPRRIQRWRDGG